MNLLKLLFTFSLIFLFIIKSIAQDLGYKEVQLTHNNFDDRYASYNSEGSLIIFESNRDGQWQIYSMDINGNQQKRVITSNKKELLLVKQTIDDRLGILLKI